MPNMFSQISLDDHYNSDTDSGKLGFTAPSVMELFNADISDFNGAVSGGLPNGWGGDSVQLFTYAKNAATDASIYCANEMDCMLKYRREYTPIIHDIVPNQKRRTDGKGGNLHQRISSREDGITVGAMNKQTMVAVSYTHLTLPTT